MKTRVTSGLLLTTEFLTQIGNDQYSLSAFLDR